MTKSNAFYAQSGGVTSVINVTACAVINELRKNQQQIKDIYAGNNGILGALKEELIDISCEPQGNILKLMHTPGGAFGSCRYKLQESSADFERIIHVFKAHNIRYFFYNGGNDSMDTAHKIAKYSKHIGYDLQCIGIPKTIDNDLAITDCCPGFGSAAKFLATSMSEANQDVASMCATSTKVFVLEVMGRHAGWLAAATAMATFDDNSPHLIIFPEILLNIDKFLALLEQKVKTHGYCCITISEGAKYETGNFLSASTSVVDSFGHQQLGGTAVNICTLIKKNLGYKYHYAISDYLQRSARHISSKVDVDQAYAVGKYAVELAMSGETDKMPVIIRKSNIPYRWAIKSASLEKIANKEKKLPKEYIDNDGFGVTQQFYDYLQPLIQGEEVPIYKNGLPVYAKLQKKLVEKKVKIYTPNI
jgi:6-phosphofructokinase 1